MTAARDRIMRSGFDPHLTDERLAAVMPEAYASNIKRYRPPIDMAAGIYRIRQTPRRLAAFLATIAVETGELRWLAEIWGPTRQQRKYEPPGKLAARLGNTQTGDGRRYRGRGLIMITGRRNYTWIAGQLDIDCVTAPERLEAPVWAAMAAGEFWRRHACNHAADKGGIEAVTRIVNGGLTHIDRRRDYYRRALEVLT